MKVKMKLGLLATVLASASLLGGCASTTKTGTLGSERKQFLLMPAAVYQEQSIQAYSQIINTAKSSQKVVTNSQVNRVTARLIPLAKLYREDSAQWKWEVNTIKSDELNAFAVAGGKIVVYTGIIEKLKLTDDELAAIIGHEMAHALREHGRERASMQMVTNLGLKYGAAAAGLGGGEQQIAQLVTNYGLTLPNSRKHESEADLVGLEIMARAGYNPNAAVNVWKKMAAATGNTGKATQFLSTHPAPVTRIEQIQKTIPTVMPHYEAYYKGKAKK
ncbi:M48 family metallopeptidase [Acinetobacter sp. YH12153]|uniref:M48 family metallopeptidase n=1 Tax=Acinetobacter sp. YH12153 TaxID=2601133 RepID=UPI00211F11F3|nr:M48 family metallopeptidase [Acinetobacter sp. YH12153]